MGVKREIFGTFALTLKCFALYVNSYTYSAFCVLFQKSSRDMPFHAFHTCSQYQHVTDGLWLYRPISFTKLHSSKNGNFSLFVLLLLNAFARGEQFQMSDVEFG